MKYILTVLLLADLSANAESLTRIVLDAETKKPLPFANISVSGKNRGTVSNSEGYFVLGMEGVDPDDMIMISYVGYETTKITATEFRKVAKIYLRPASIKLQEVEVSSRSLSAHEIIALVRKNFDRNHPTLSQKQRIFLHKYERTPFPEENNLVVKKSDFVGMDKDTFDELRRKLPHEFIEYQDALVELHRMNKEYKVVPVEGISLEEGSQKALMKEFENKLGVFLEDIEKSKKDKDVYYKFRTGVLKVKAGHRSDEVLTPGDEDSLHYIVKTDQIRDDILFLLKDYASIESKNWEFIGATGKYRYAIEDITVFNDEVVYAISFTPERRGLFEGLMHISTSTFAVVHLDFAFAPGKRNEHIQMFGFGHTMNFKKGHVIFEREEAGYFVKYIYAEQNESASVHRNFTVMKKHKRLLTDKTLNKMELEANLKFDMHSYWELLVIEQETIGLQQFERVKQPSWMKFKKEYAYSAEMWSNRTVIAPSSELRKYTRK